jgi:XTP/dITP diphosphohydrolase
MDIVDARIAPSKYTEILGLSEIKSFLSSRVLFLVTGNVHKFNEARFILSEYGVALCMMKKIDLVEYQDDNVETIAMASSKDAVERFNLPVAVEDAGLLIRALNGFPGPYSSYVYRTIGNPKILKLMEGVNNRDAYFKSAVAFNTPHMDEPLCFVGKVKGTIVKKERGVSGFGFDPIFIPLGSSKTFAEMTVREKNRFSHRALAFREFAKWYSLGITPQKS